ncbi:MAG: hypothetical protein AMXMBFR84_42470 [Candidatus Hydrogenedentota bacterium]
MTRWYPCLLLTLGLISFAYGEADPGSNPETLQVSESQLSFGEVMPDASPRREIRLTNNGSTAISGISAKSSCFCTIVELSKALLKPGEHATIGVSLDLAKYPSNDVHSIITVADDRSTTLQVSVFATVKPEFLIEPESLDFGDVKAGKTFTRQVIVRQNGRQTIVLNGIRSPKELVANVITTDSEAGRGDSPGTIVLSMTLTAPLRPGAWRDTVILQTNVARIPEYRLPVQAMVPGIQAKLRPKVLVFGKAKAGEPIGEIIVESGNEIVIEQIASLAETVVAAVTKSEKGKQPSIQVRLTPHAARGPMQTKLNLTLSEGDLTQVFTVGVFGTVE